MNKLLGFFLALLLATPCFAQDGTNHSMPVFGGPGFVGFREAGPCASGQVLAWSGGSTADPSCVSNNGTTSVLITDPPFNAVCDGATDDTTAIQNAINSLPTNGGVVLFPSKNCKITSTISIGNGNSTPTASTRNGIVLQGIGNPTALTCCSFPISGGPRLTWAGGTGSPMIKVQGPLSGWGVKSLTLNCASTTGSVGLMATAATFGDVSNLLVLDCGGQGITTNSYPNFGSLHNYWRNIAVRIPAIVTAIGVLVTGDGVGNTSNTSFDHWANVAVFIPAVNTTGLLLQSADSNQFHNIHLYGGGGGTSSGVVFDYTAAGVAGIFPASNMFFGLEPSSAVLNTYVNIGAPGAGAQPNIVYGHEDANGAVIPNLPNLAVYGSKKIVLSTGLGATNNTQIVPPTAPAAPVTFNIPATVGTGTVVASGSYATNGLLYATGTSTLTNADRCSMDANQAISCTSAAGPNWVMTNTANDASSGSMLIQKNRAGGNTLNNDSLFLFLTRGFANGGQQNAAAMFATQVAASAGNNIPTKLSFQTSNAVGQLNQALNFDDKGHLGVTASIPPTASACAGFALGTGSSDAAGRVSYTSATTCTINFGVAYANAPFCQITPGQAASTMFATTSTTQLAVTFGTAQTSFFYQCLGN